MPFFSIIIPLYNKERFIEATLDSIIQQSFSDFEVLVINDGSTDSGEAKVLACNDSRIRYFSQQNAGVSTARNFGVQHAQSDYLTFIDADDYWYPDLLQEFFSMIHAYPDQVVFSAAIENETPTNIVPASYSTPKSGDRMVVNYFEASYKQSVICTSCAVFHKSVFEKIGAFDTKIRSGQDTDMWIRIGQVYPVVFSFKILARYVYDAHSLSKNKQYLHNKIDFLKFTSAEKTNPALKKFLDLNRYSFAIKCKLNNESVNLRRYTDEIDTVNLTLKKRILLFMPGFVLRFLLKLNTVLVQLGLSHSVVK